MTENEINNFHEKQSELILSVRKAFDLETDRGVCIMASDLLDNLLKELLNLKLLGSNNLKKDLFDYSGPLGTFSSRQKLAFSIGLIHRETFDDLEIIRNVRNKFSHSHLHMDFNTEKVRNEIKRMVSNIHNVETAEPRNIFTNTVIGVAVAIYGSQLLAEKFKSIERPDFLDGDFKQEVKQNSNNYYK